MKIVLIGSMAARGRRMATAVAQHLGGAGRRRFAAVLAGAGLATLSACAPTIRVQVAPINIYAKLDADVRVRLDKEVQSLIQQNPNLF